MLETVIRMEGEHQVVTILGTTIHGSLRVSLRGMTMYISKRTLDIMAVHPELDLQIQKVTTVDGKQIIWLV